MAFSIRWMIRRDIPKIIAFDDGVTHDDVLNTVRRKNVISLVVEDHHEQILAYTLYELHKGRLRIMRLIVAPESRRMGIGTVLIQKVMEKGSMHGRTGVVLTVPERNLAAQLFLRKQGFIATQVVPGYCDNGDDGYEMVFETHDPVAAS